MSRARDLSGFIDTAMTAGFGAPGTPDEGARVIVRTALEQQGESGVFFDYKGPLLW